MITKYQEQNSLSFNGRSSLGSIQKLGAFFFVIFCLLPYTSFGTNNLDSQPWPVLIGLIMILFLKGQVVSTKYVNLSFLIVLTGFFWSLILTNSIDFFTIRAAYNYMSFFLVLVIFFTILHHYGPPINLIKFINYIWIFAVFVQAIAPDIIGALGNSRSSVERGFTSLASEPSNFAYYLIFSSLLVLKLRNHNWRADLFLHLVNILSVIFLAMSSVGLIMLLVIALVYFFNIILTTKPKKVGIGILLIGVVCVILLLNFMPLFLGDSRVGYLVLQALKENPLLLLKADASINYRLEHVVFSFHGAFNNYFIPGGIDTFADIRDDLNQFYNGYFWWGRPSKNIQCWLGDWIYILGGFGFLSLISLFYQSSNGSRQDFFFFVSIALLLLVAVPPAFPLIPMIFASGIYGKQKPDQINFSK
tara:strand:- start:8727 stop:9980 length:1254 start_codon:yes stop_codon:yes gene_type:complete